MTTLMYFHPRQRVERFAAGLVRTYGYETAQFLCHVRGNPYRHLSDSGNIWRSMLADKGVTIDRHLCQPGIRAYSLYRQAKRLIGRWERQLRQAPEDMPS